ncbi:MAG TPA: sigma-54 dependent transcriptional regulator [Vicinamibacteria bacterium]
MTVAAPASVPGVIALSPAMRALLPVLQRLAEARSAVLLEGESGSGKDLLAHWLHYGGPRSVSPFIRVHCPSIPEELLESELFGHERGAFTDAKEAKLGKIEMARGGTLYFDQVQDLSLALQAKLLRVVEERSFERVGGTRTIEVDVRFVSSTNVDLGVAVSAGRFREDLFHRLNVVPVRVPPLRERREDIAPLAELFLARERGRGTTVAAGFAPETLDALRGHLWPGNVRELRSVVERASLFATGEVVPLRALPPSILEAPEALWAGRERRPTLRDVEQAYIRFVLDETSGSQTRTASVLGISRKALWEKRRRFGIP